MKSKAKFPKGLSIIYTAPSDYCDDDGKRIPSYWIRDPNGQRCGITAHRAKQLIASGVYRLWHADGRELRGWK